jgi:hypothetical protein
LKRILILAAISLLLCSTANAFQGGAGESTKKKPNPTKTSATTSGAEEKQALPKFRPGTPYRTVVRKRLIKLGWRPVTLPSATPCGEDDYRCQGLPEVYFCSGVGSAMCSYTWRKQTTLIEVWAFGELVDQKYHGLGLSTLQFSKSETIRTEERETDDCAFCGTWHFVGSPIEVIPNGYYLKISRAGTGKLKLIEGFNEGDKISWSDDPVRNADGIYLKMLNGRLEARFVTSNFLYSTQGNETTYRITCELLSSKKMRYSVWSAIRGKTDKFVGTNIGN